MSSGPGPGSLRPHGQVGSAARVRSEVVLGGRPRGHESVPEQVGASPGLPQASPMGWETLLRDGGVLEGVAHTQGHRLVTCSALVRGPAVWGSALCSLSFGLPAGVPSGPLGVRQLRVAAPPPPAAGSVYSVAGSGSRAALRHRCLWAPESWQVRPTWHSACGWGVQSICHGPAQRVPSSEQAACWPEGSATLDGERRVSVTGDGVRGLGCGNADSVPSWLWGEGSAAPSQLWCSEDPGFARHSDPAW